MSKTTDYKVQWTPELREAVDNRIIEYLLQGYSQQEAEEKALLDLLDHTTFNYPEVTVIAQAPVQKQVATESDWDPGYTKFMSGLRYYADQDHKNYLDWLRNEYTRGIRETTDKWGHVIGAGVEIASGFTPLWWVAPTVRTGLDLSEGNYKGAALNAGLAFAAPYVVGKVFQYGDDLYRGYKTITNPKEMYAPMAEALTPVKTSSAGIWTNRGTKSAKISKAERLGIPKGDRGNLSASQQEAVRDLHHYITDGKFKLRFLFDAETNLFFWGNAKPTPSTNAITTIAQHPQATIRLGDDGIGYMRIPTLYGTLTYFPHLKTTSHTISFPKSKINPQGFGEAAARAENLFGKSVILTSPKIDATDAGVVVEGLSSTVPKRQVYDFYKQLALTSKPGTYVTGDAAAYPLGHQAIVDYVGGNSTKAVATILSGETPTVTAASRTGLSPDSYISLLRSAQRPEWKLSFNRKLGFGKWNNSAVNNSDIYNAWQAARNGTLELKLAYIQLFNDWVAPYGGAKAYINDKGIIIHPHPFIVRQKSGGSIHIKKKNKGKFTDYCGGKVTEECIRKGKNSSNPTTRKRANFAWVARHKFKHEEGGKLNYLNYFN